MSNPRPPAPPTELDPGGAPSRAERLLTAMHRVFGHDLPNQLVVVQGLIGLMQEDEKDLSAEGKEHLQRLRQAAIRASNMVHFLKDMARLVKFAESVEDIRLSALARELQGELNQIYPGRDIRIETSWQVPSLVAGWRSLQQALIQLLRCGIDQVPGRAVAVRLSSTRAEKATEILVSVHSADAAPPSSPPSVVHDRTSTEQRLEFILASESLSLWGGTLKARPQLGCVLGFAIGIPGQ